MFKLYYTLISCYQKTANRAELIINQNIHKMDKKADLMVNRVHYFHCMRAISPAGIMYHTPFEHVSLLFRAYQVANNSNLFMLNIGYIQHNKAAFD